MVVFMKQFQQTEPNTASKRGPLEMVLGLLVAQASCSSLPGSRQALLGVGAGWLLLPPWASNSFPGIRVFDLSLQHGTF